MPIFVTTIHTRLPASEVRRRLSAIIEERTGPGFLVSGAWGPGRTGAVFAGTRDDASFKVMRLIRYRNSFLPVVRGRLVQGGMGTDIRLVMMLHPFVATFMLLWCGGLTLGVARGLAEGDLPWLAVGPLLICLFGIVVTAIGFFPEAAKAKRLIRESLQASTAALSKMERRLDG